MQRYLGIDIGAETTKVVELSLDGDGSPEWTRRQIVEHQKEPGPALLALLRGWGWNAASVAGAAVSGRLSRQVLLQRVPTKQAQAAGYRFLHSVLELRPTGVEVFRENSRCSQGTGNFLRQLVERFNLSIEEASALCAE